MSIKLKFAAQVAAMLLISRVMADGVMTSQALLNPMNSELIALPTPPSLMSQWLYTMRWWALGVVVIALTLWARFQGKGSALSAFAGLVILGASLVLGKPLLPAPAVTEQVVGDLLRNVYRSFDYREESDIHEALARSVSGELLTDIYRETRRSLELANQGPVRARVKSVELQSLDVRPAAGARGFRAEATWTLSASVVHRGHVQTRDKRYQAVLDIRAIDGRWKLTGMKLPRE